MKNVAAGANPMIMKQGINKAVDAVVEEIRKITSLVSKIYCSSCQLRC